MEEVLSLWSQKAERGESRNWSDYQRHISINLLSQASFYLPKFPQPLKTVPLPENHVFMPVASFLKLKGPKMVLLRYECEISGARVECYGINVVSCVKLTRDGL